MNTKSRYTDDEMVEFDALLDRAIAEAESDQALLTNALANDQSFMELLNTPPGETPLTFEEVKQLRNRQEKYIKHLHDAKKRIANKTYGICRVTGRLISKERLRQVPHATLSIEAKLQLVHKTKEPAPGS